MIRHNHLFSKIVDVENILLAHQNARKGKSHYSDVNKVDGEKVSIDAVLGQDLEIIAFRVRNSRYTRDNNGNYTIIQFVLNGQKYVVFTGSLVLLDQLQKHEDKLPFRAQIKKIGTYYTFS